MMMRILPLVLVSLFFTFVLFGQNDLNWKKHKKIADKLFEANQYIDAAVHYEAAWQQQTKERGLIYKAGECYLLTKDFKKTIHALQFVKNENKRFPLVGLKYARALKQDGQYPEAKEAFIYFINAYQGEDKAIIASIVANEIKGCEEALSLTETKPITNVKVRHLSENINSPAIEFAPIPYADDLLYYSSTMKGNQAYLFRTQRKNGTWQKAVIAEGLPNFPEKHFANGSFAPDAKRFYFTLCKDGDGVNSTCEIYVLKREKAGWSESIRLRDYINIDHAQTTTQPWVVHQNGQEILYFSSDREGGYGEMDIWYSTRDISSDDIDFTYPVNAGSEINTLGDEITPFYHLEKETLYFSSNGKITLGGWDIFKAKGMLDQWEKSENLGTPINSSADEFYYVIKPSGKGGFLTSNRLHGVEKISTQDEDLFEFGIFEKAADLYSIGQIMDNETMSPIRDVRVSLYEHINGKTKLLSSKKIAQSQYRFKILPDKKLRLVAEKMGYLKNIFDFDSFKADGTIDYTHIFSLAKRTDLIAAPSEKLAVSLPNFTVNNSASKDDNIIDEPKKTASNSVSVASNQHLTTTNSIQNNRKSASNNPKSANNIGTYYKVQVVAVNYHDINHPRYNKVKKIGRIETEDIPQKGITRVLISDLTNKQVAEEVKQQVVQSGFVDAFVVKYKDGKRVGRIW